MSERSTISLNDDLDHAIERGIKYLHEHQLPNGEYMSYYAPDEHMKEWCVPDSIVFFTSVISGCMLKIKVHPKVAEMLSLSANFLKYQMMRGGVWNYFTKWNPLFEYSPADIDDTVVTSYVLRNLKVDFTENNSILLSNMNSAGLFYTWFVIRSNSFFSKELFSVMARELKRPLKSIIFWKKHQGGRNDTDVGVNANVLFYLGLNHNTQKVKAYLQDVILKDKELNSDKWYANPIILYYLISRNHPAVNFSNELKERIIEKTYTFYSDKGLFGGSALETALAIMTLLNFGNVTERIEKAIDFLLQTQRDSGEWNRHIFFYSGPAKAVGWGSEELTTAFCIEALNQYRMLTTT